LFNAYMTQFVGVKALQFELHISVIHSSLQQHYALNTGTFFFPRVEVTIPSVNYKTHCPIVYIYKYSSLFLLLMLHWFIFVEQILYSNFFRI